MYTNDLNDKTEALLWKEFKPPALESKFDKVRQSHILIHSFRCCKNKYSSGPELFPAVTLAANLGVKSMDSSDEQLLFCCRVREPRVPLGNTL